MWLYFLQVSRVDFSEPQGGKGPCDRKAANIKAHIRRHLNEGHDVDTPEEMYKAITSGDGVRGVRVALVDASSVSSISTGKLDGISKLNNFSYSNNGLTYWRQYEIGEGKTQKWSTLKGISMQCWQYILAQTSKVARHAFNFILYVSCQHNDFSFFSLFP